MLGDASEADKQWIKDNVSVVVDFRSEIEINEAPDPFIEGVEFIHYPVIDDLAAGVTRDEKSDEEAIDKAEDLKAGSNLYPVHYSVSDTSGEKAYEEFYIGTEEVDMERLSSLGVITNKEIPDKRKVAALFEKLNVAFVAETSKEEIVAIMKEYLPNFDHIEKGKSLDSKM